MEIYNMKVLCLLLMLNTSAAYFLLNPSNCEGVENPSTFEIVELNCNYRGPGIYVFRESRTIMKVTMDRLTEEAHVRIEEGGSLERFVILVGSIRYCHLVTAPSSVLVMMQQTPCGDQTTIINAEKTTETRDGVVTDTRDGVTTGSTEATIQAKSSNQGAMSTESTTHDNGYVETSTITQHAQNENTKIPIAWIATTVTTVTDYLEVVLIVLVTIIYSGRQLLEMIQRNPLMPPLPLPPAQPVLQPNPPAQPVQQPNPPAQPVQQPNHPVRQHRQRRALQPIPQIRRGQRVRRGPDRFQIYEL